MIIFGTATDNADWIIGDDGNDWIYGAGGNDLLQGGGGNDLLLGNDGDDTLVPGLGVDFVYGGFLNGDSGNDTVSYTLYGGGVYASLATGYGYLRSLGDADKDTLRGIENIRGSAYDDILAGDGGANKLYGNGGKDDLSGHQGNDSLYGGAGDDRLTGGSGADLLDGGSGTDTIYYEDSAGVIISLVGGFGIGGDAEGDSVTGVENVIGSPNDDWLFGNAVANELYGDSGKDNLYGYEGNDELRGGDGDDGLNGGANNDRLIGGRGKDMLTGGTGADTFVFHAILASVDSALDTARSDVITDFSRVQGDKIDLSSMDANPDLAGNQAFTFIGGSDYSGTAGEIRTSQIDGNSWVSGDIDGDGNSDFRIMLTGQHQLTASDFIL